MTRLLLSAHWYSTDLVAYQARRIHPYLARFENDWATAAIVKQYMSSARRYGRRKGYFSCAHEARVTARNRTFDDEMNGDDE